MSKSVIVKVTTHQYITIFTALLIDIYIIRATQLEFEKKMYES